MIPDKTDETEIKLVAHLQRVIAAENMTESGLDKWTVEGQMKRCKSILVVLNGSSRYRARSLFEL